MTFKKPDVTPRLNFLFRSPPLPTQSHISAVILGRVAVSEPDTGFKVKSDLDPVYKMGSDPDPV